MKGFDNTSYGDAFADVYDDWYGDVSDVDATIATLVRLVDAHGEPVVVELGVGTGRLAIPLTAALPTAHVVGIDTSQAMLDRLRANDHDGRVVAVCADMVSGLDQLPTNDQTNDQTTSRFPIEASAGFDLVFVAYNTLFNLTGPGDQAACFAAVARHLRPGGRFVVEAFVPDEPPRGGSDVAVRSIAVDRVVLSVSRHDPNARSAEGQFIELTESGGVRLRPWSIQYSSPTELDAMAAAAGLELESRLETFDGRPFDAESERHVSVYRKPDPTAP